MLRNFLLVLTATLAVIVAAPAAAAWQRASSPHFIIYSQEDPEMLRAYAAKLERFDSAVRIARGIGDPTVGDGNRLTVFVARNVTEVARLKPGSGNIAGFYLPRASGSIAVVPRVGRMRSDLHPDVIFQHEYAHHLMFADLKAAIPMWLVEGFAEFYATANIRDDGSVGLGGAATHRRTVLWRDIGDLSISSIVGGVRPTTGPEMAALYAKGWLLTHYLTFAEKRRGQLDRYLAEIAAGRELPLAARTAFGDLAALESEVNQYLRAERFPYLTIPAAQIRQASIEVETLGPGADAVMPLYMRLQARTPGDAAANAAEARSIAAAHPSDPLVMMTLAEAEWVARNYKAAEAAAEKAIALMPQSAEAHIWKGRALLSRAIAREPGVTFANARGWFNRANRLDPENPEPLYYFYQSFGHERIRPTANAIEALHYAASLAPQDMGLRLTSAREHLAAGRTAEARTMLVPVAFNPHGGSSAETAKAMLAKLDAGEAAAAQASAK